MKLKIFPLLLSVLLCLALAACQPPEQDGDNETTETTLSDAEDETTTATDNADETTAPPNDPAQDDPFNDILK